MPAQSGDLVVIQRGSVLHKLTAGEVAGLAQEPLVSGINIKTINGESVLGSGNIVISGGGGGGGASPIISWMI